VGALRKIRTHAEYEKGWIHLHEYRYAPYLES